MDLFSVQYFETHLRDHVHKHHEFNDMVDTMNSYYRSIVSTIIHEERAASSEMVERIRNLDTAYRLVKEKDLP